MIEDGRDLRRLLPDRRALLSRAARAAPCSSPRLLPRWIAFYPGDLFTVGVRRDGLPSVGIEKIAAISGLLRADLVSGLITDGGTTLALAADAMPAGSSRPGSA